MMNPLISVIVPIYNVEHYLDQCIQSVMNQTYTNLEIILVNDGSTDKSGEICDKYLAKDIRIKVIHKANGGANSARKVGIKEAKGQYCGFVDSDDWIDASMYEEMLALCERHDADIVASGFIIEKDGKQTQEKNNLEEGLYTKEKLKNQLYSKMMYSSQSRSFSISPSLSNKMFKTALIYPVLTTVDERIVIGEDAAVVYPTFLKATRIYLTSRCWYHYRQRTDSVSRVLDNTYFETIIIFREHIKAYMLNQPNEQDLLKQLHVHMEMLYDYGAERLLGIVKKRVWLFPYQAVANDSKIILYGAGKIGQIFCEQIKLNNYCQIIQWIDSNFEKCNIPNHTIEDPKKIRINECDHVLIAIKNQEQRNEATQFLIGIGVPKGKIINESIHCLN